MSRLANRRPPRSSERNRKRKTRSLAIHDHNEAGSKLSRRFAKAILRRKKEPARSRTISFDRSCVVRAKWNAEFRRD